MFKVKVFNPTGIELPQISTPKSAAKDIRANLALVKPELCFDADIAYVFDTIKTGLYDRNTDTFKDPAPNLVLAIVIYPNGRVLIPSGLKMELPEGFHMDVRPRSGLALKYGVELVNSPGLIDEDYRGDVGIILKNGGEETIIIVDKDRIGQIMLAPDYPFGWEEVDSEEDLESTERGEGGFSSTGTK